MPFFDNKENTYYMKDIPNVVNKSSFLQEEYDNQTGFFGKKLIENPYLSDQAKLSVIERVKPQYKNEINLVKKTLPYIKKAENIKQKYFSGSDRDLQEQYQIHRNSDGGKSKKIIKRKSKKIIKGKSKKRIITR